MLFCYRYFSLLSGVPGLTPVSDIIVYVFHALRLVVAGYVGDFAVPAKMMGAMPVYVIAGVSAVETLTIRHFSASSRTILLIMTVPCCLLMWNIREAAAFVVLWVFQYSYKWRSRSVLLTPFFIAVCLFIVPSLYTYGQESQGVF